jgi:adenosylcobinamide-GDP ribazoletransferase
VFCQKRPTWAAAWAVGLALAAGWVSAGAAGLTAAAAAIIATLLVAWQCQRKIGGGTGDTYGAACEIAEAAVALTMAAWTTLQGRAA